MGVQMRVLIDNYRNLTSEHCASGAMRNLLYHYCKLELDEAVVFGLGSGLDCIFFSLPSAATPSLPESLPPYMLFGRSISMEQDLAAALGVDYREIMQPDDELAWQRVRQEILTGHPTMLSGDIYYLDYRNFKIHYPSHRFVLLGFDDERQEVYIADRTECETQTCSIEALRLSRNPPVGISTYNLWGKFHGSKLEHSLAEACELALCKTVKRMQGIDDSQAALLRPSLAQEPRFLVGGLAGLEQLAAELPRWSHRADATQRADYLVNAIEKFGTGGAFFRNLFAGFLQWSRRQRPELVSGACLELAQKSAQQWDGLADIVRPLLKQSHNPDQWQQARHQLLAAHATEYELFGRLAEAVI